MNRILLRFLILLLSTSHGYAADAVPRLINYQGRLTDTTGAPLPAGTYRVAIRLWSDAATASTNNPNHLIWGAEYGVTLVSGAFNVILGAPGGSTVPGAAVNDISFAFGDANRFLGITVVTTPSGAVASPKEILPRQQILSAPFALRSGDGNPPGTIIAFAGPASRIPPGWALCDGHAALQVDYPELFRVIGKYWGDGTTTSVASLGGVVYPDGDGFNFPDLRGLFLRGASIGPQRFDSGNRVIDPDRLSRSKMAAGGNNSDAEVGSIQSSIYQAHFHNVVEPNGGQGHSHEQVVSANPGSSPGSGISRSDFDFDRPQADLGSYGQGAHTAVARSGILVREPLNYQTLEPEGGSETRPVNAYVHYLIKY